jgi:murein hydrolase activator
MLRFVAASFLLAGSTALVASAPVQPEAVPVDLQLEQARAEATAAEAEQRRLESAAAKASDEVSRLRAQQLAAVQAIAAAEAQISAADARARLVHSQLVSQRQRLAKEQAPVSSLLTGLALMSRRPPVLLLADSGSAQDLVKLRLLIEATSPAILARTAALTRELEKSSRFEQAALGARDEMVRTRAVLSRRRHHFAKLEARAIQLAETRGSEALEAGDVALARQEQLSLIQRQSKSGRSSAQLARRLAELGPAPLPSGAGEGALLAPIRYRLPADAAVTDGLGAVSASGVRSRGITLATRRGAALIVPASGTILFAGPFRDYDGVVIIDHGRGWKSVLVNAGSRLSRGSRVEIGEPLGIALGPLEVQLQHGGEPVSPALIAGSSGMLSNEAETG